MTGRTPISRVGYTEACMAADWLVEHADGLWPADRVTPARVAYLRRVPGVLVDVLAAHVPHTRVKWVYEHPLTPRARARGGSKPRVTEIEKVCFPAAALRLVVDHFLKPAGKSHVAEIDVLVPLDPAAVVDLSLIPRPPKESADGTPAEGA